MQNKQYLTENVNLFLFFLTTNNIIAIRKKQLHSKDNIPPILHWIWIGAGLEVNWTWIGAATILKRKRNEIKMWFSDVGFLF